jgi:hypothetical protein
VTVLFVLPSREIQAFNPQPDAFFFSAQRFFIASEMRFLPAAVIPPLRFLGADLPANETGLRDAVGDFELRAAHRAFIAWDSRLLPAGVIPLPRFGATALTEGRLGDAAKPTPSSRALIALPIRSRSLFSSETILSKSNSDLLYVVDS